MKALLEIAIQIVATREIMKVLSVNESPLDL